MAMDPVIGPLFGFLARNDRAREKGLFRYYRPERAVNNGKQTLLPTIPSSGPRTSTDPHLTALAQLVTLRMNTKRCIISVVHRDVSYVISEATRSLQLSDTTRSDLEGDELFFGCSTVPRSESMCDHVVSAPGAANDGSIFLIPDMSKDDRFRDRPFVTGGPRFMFYAGAPLRTFGGTKIGAVAAIDDKARIGLSEDERDFLLHVAGLVMTHLELRREAEEKNKLQRLSQGLGAFVQGRDKVTFGDMFADPTNRPSLNGFVPMNVPQSSDPAAALNGNASAAEPAEFERRSSLAPRLPTEESLTSDVQSASPDDSEDEKRPRQSPEQVHAKTLSRAAALIWEAMDLQGSGGVVFLDTAGGTINAGADIDVPTAQDKQANQTDNEAYSVGFSNEMKAAPAEVLAQCIGSNSMLKAADDEENHHAALRPMPQEALRRMIRRYPKGKLWVFDEDWTISSSEDEKLLAGQNQPGMLAKEKVASKRKRVEAQLLRHCFPEARYLIFFPLLDASESRQSSACFCYTSNPSQFFSQEADLTFMTVFSNSITAEISRLMTIDADRKKIDFLGSISHELRSPLHGILASTEFLAESKCDMFQANLIDTIGICGRTLLDEINHILEFSRINSFEKSRKNQQKIKLSRTYSGSPNGRASATLPGGLSVLGNTNVAAITEEVIEGVFAGQRHANFSSLDMCDLTKNAQKLGLEQATSDPPLVEGRSKNEQRVEVVLDFDHLNYKCVTHPGALRRIIMNIFTNSLKYTDEGMIYVNLHTEEVDDPASAGKSRAAVVLTVRDTGRGMSSSYLRTQLFTPFAQENSLSPGTGLGLSIVRSIVSMLEGTINVQSQQFKGTEVRITLPILPSPKTGGASDLPNSSESVREDATDSVSILRSSASGQSIALCGFHGLPANPKRFCDFYTVLRTYVTDWYGLECTDEFNPSQPPDLVILHEHIQEYFLQSFPTALRLPIIILCNDLQYEARRSDLPDHAFHLSKPFGPYRLAKAMRACLDKTKAQPQLDSTKMLRIRGGNRLEEFSLAGLGEQSPILAHNGSENAQMAVSPATEKRNKEFSGFPFPGNEHASTYKPVKGKDIGEIPSRAMKLGPTVPPTLGAKTPGAPHHQVGVTSSTSASVVTETSAAFPARTAEHAPGPTKRLPSVLLVDDNRINLMLLQTFMKKRSYRSVDQAENGQLAVDAARAHDYDIIFMDISSI